MGRPGYSDDKGAQLSQHADRISKLTVEAFSFRFKCLSGSPARLSTMLRIVRYGVAVSDELVQYRDVAPSFYLSP